jgi:hypothetical protein
MKRPAFFPITLLPCGDVGLDLAKMDDEAVVTAYEQFKTPSRDWERASADKRELVRLKAELEARNLWGYL